MDFSKFLESLGLFFKPELFIANLQKMGIGMLIIFVLICVIILATMVINALFSTKKK